MELSAFEKIREIQARADQEIKQLRQQAISEVVRRLSEAKELVKDLEIQYTSLTGKNLKGEAVTGSKSKPAKKDFSSVEELTDVLTKAPGRKLNRKGFSVVGYSLKSAIGLARQNPKSFDFLRKGPQGEVWLK